MIILIAYHPLSGNTFQLVDDAIFANMHKFPGMREAFDRPYTGAAGSSGYEAIFDMIVENFNITKAYRNNHSSVVYELTEEQFSNFTLRYL